MKTNGFGYLLREHRENGKISLRRLADEANLDYAYLSRLEREMSPVPRQEVIRRISKALCYCQDLTTIDCERLQRELMDAAGMLINDVDLLKDLRSRFADLLRNKGLSEPQIIYTMKKVSLDTMEKILNGEEPLEIQQQGYISSKDIAEVKARGEEVIQIVPPSINKAYRSRRVKRVRNLKRFRAGTRAYINVLGDLTSTQEEQLRSITTLVRSILR